MRRALTGIAMVVVASCGGSGGNGAASPGDDGGSPDGTKGSDGSGSSSGTGSGSSSGADSGSSSGMDASSDANPPDSGTGCVIGGTTYAGGAPNPTNACQSCKPGKTTTAWTNLPDGTSCGAGKTCNAGSCESQLQTVFLIVMEDNNWSTIKGNAAAPYINSLLATGAHAESYYDNPKGVHPSEPNYIWLEAGDNLGITTNVDPSASHLLTTTSHLVTLLANANVTWRAYVEGITTGTCPIVSSGQVVARHTPMLFFSDIVGNPPSTSSAPCISHVRSYAELATDLSGGTVAHYNFITPNLCDDMQGGTGCATGSALITAGDTWLSTEVPKIMASQAYLNGGAIFITWDESVGGEFPIGMIVLSPKAKVGYSNGIKYYHSSMLRTVQKMFGVTPLLNDAATQPDLADLFTSFP